MSSVSVKLNTSDKKLTIVVPSRQYFFSGESEELKVWSDVILERKERLLGGGVGIPSDPVFFFLNFIIIIIIIIFSFLLFSSLFLCFFIYFFLSPFLHP